jgi:hypothetical protein
MSSRKINADVESMLSEDMDDSSPDYRKMSRNRCGWIVLLSIIIIGLLSFIIYREIATPLKEYYDTHDKKG